MISVYLSKDLEPKLVGVKVLVECCIYLLSDMSVVIFETRQNNGLKRELLRTNELRVPIQRRSSVFINPVNTGT